MIPPINNSPPVYLPHLTMESKMDSIFKSTAQYYSKYRPPYPKEMFDYIRVQIQKEGKGKYADLGCGTGFLTLPLSRYFDQTIAVEVDSDMLEAAKEEAQLKSIIHIQWKHQPAENFDDSPGLYQLITIGSALHWMEIDKVLKTSFKLLQSEGVLAIFGMPSLWNGEEEWQKSVIKVIQKWLGKERRVGTQFYSAPSREYEEYLKEAGFTRIKKIIFNMDYRWNLETILGYLYSTSFCSKEQLKENALDFQKDLEKALKEINPDGVFEQMIPVSLLIAQK